MAFLLASDLDGTLIPALGAAAHTGPGHAAPTGPGAGGWPAGPAARRCRAAVRRIGERASYAGWRLMYATGRHLALTLEGIEAFDLPAPDVVACDVGTSLYWRRGGAMTADDDYRERIASVPGVLPAAEVRARLDGVAGISPQDEERQADFKVSYHVDRPLDEGLLAELRRRLAPGRLRLVASHDSVSGRGLLDVLPSEVGKATAIRWVADVLRLSDDEVVFAGDSGNDRDAILAGTRAIVVGNAPSGLRSELRGEATRSGVESRVYFASAPHAEGVVEGLGHFGAWPTPDL